jgi:hypothetical protein
MKNGILFVLFLGLLFGCAKKTDEKDDDTIDPALKGGLASGEWTAASSAGGYVNLSSFKNFQYTFEVPVANQTLNFDLTSADIDVNFTLFDPLGQYLESSSTGRKVTEQYLLKAAGTYRIVVTAERRAVGKFVLKIDGTKDGLVPIPFQTLRSDTQNWGDLGGGGNRKTFKNHFYTFDVTEDNSSVDVEMQSPDTEITLYLYDALGTLVSQKQGPRYDYILKDAKKGSYTIMAGTSARGSVGTYSVNVFGKVQNLKRVESKSETVKGNWSTGKSADTYSIEITSANNSPLDIELSSGDVEVRMDLQNGTGDMISYAGLSKTEYIISRDLPKGNYRILVHPYFVNRSGGNYSLTVNGQFANLKKM